MSTKKEVDLQELIMVELINSLVKQVESLKKRVISVDARQHEIAKALETILLAASSIDRISFEVVPDDPAGGISSLEPIPTIDDNGDPAY